MSDNDPNPKSPAETSGNEDFLTLETRMVSSMPGLEARLNFGLNAVDGTEMLWALRSTMGLNVRLFVVSLVAFFDGYSPIAPSSAQLRVDLAGEADPSIPVIVHPTTGSCPHTANLLALLVINPDTMSTLQVVLKGQDWPLQTPTGDPKQFSSHLSSASFSKIPSSLILISTGIRFGHLEANYARTTAQILEDERISLLDASHLIGEKIPTVKKSCQI